MKYGMSIEKDRLKQFLDEFADSELCVEVNGERIDIKEKFKDVIEWLVDAVNRDPPKRGRPKKVSD